MVMVMVMMMVMEMEEMMENDDELIVLTCRSGSFPVCSRSPTALLEVSCTCLVQTHSPCWRILKEGERARRQVRGVERRTGQRRAGKGEDGEVEEEEDADVCARQGVRGGERDGEEGRDRTGRGRGGMDVDGGGGVARWVRTRSPRRRRRERTLRGGGGRRECVLAVGFSRVASM
eukprot:283930-Hanusia_phi.AAC.1